MIGCLLAKRVPARKLKVVIALIAIFAGLQLVWTGSRTLMARHAAEKRERDVRKSRPQFAAIQLDIKSKL